MTDEQQEQLWTQPFDAVYRLLIQHKDELQETHQEVKSGITIKLHIAWWLNGKYLDRGYEYTFLDNNRTTYTFEDWHNELEEREHRMRKALAKLYQQEPAPWERE